MTKYRIPKGIEGGRIKRDSSGRTGQWTDFVVTKEAVYDTKDVSAKYGEYIFFKLPPEVYPYVYVSFNISHIIEE